MNGKNAWLEQKAAEKKETEQKSDEAAPAAEASAEQAA